MGFWKPMDESLALRLGFSRVFFIENLMFYDGEAHD